MPDILYVYAVRTYSRYGRGRPSYRLAQAYRPNLESSKSTPFLEIDPQMWHTCSIDPSPANPLPKVFCFVISPDTYDFFVGLSSGLIFRVGTRSCGSEARPDCTGWDSKGHIKCSTGQDGIKRDRAGLSHHGIARGNLNGIDI